MILRKTIAFVLIILFALLVIPTIFIRSLAKTYVNPDFYEAEVITESYDYMVSFLSNQIEKDTKISKYFEAQDIEEIIKTHFTIDAVQEVVQDFVSQLKGVSDKRKDDAITVSLIPLKANIENLADDVSVKMMNTIPTCATEEEIELLSQETQEGELPSCIPTESIRSELTVKLKREIERGMNEIIPGEFSIDLTTNGEGGETQLKQIVFVLNYAQMILPLFLLVLLLLIMLVIYKPHTLIMKYIGGALSLGGIFGLVSIQLIAQIPTATISSEAIPGLLENELLGLREFYSFLLGFVTKQMTLYSLYFLGTGLVIFFVALYIRQFNYVKTNE